MNLTPTSVSGDQSQLPLNLTGEDILQQLQRILGSPAFSATKAQTAFLNFVVEKTIAGESDDIKGYTLATQVFGRNEDFDQNVDPIVSIHANKLRRALERYYLTDGSKDPLRIDIPKGSYVPRFSSQSEQRTHEKKRLDINHCSWPTVLIKPFKNLTGNQDLNLFGTGLATEIAVELARCQEIRVLMYGPDGQAKRVSDTPARFVIEGSVRQDCTNINVAIHLIDSSSGIQLLGEHFDSGRDATRVIALQKEISRKIAVGVAGEHGVVSRTMARDSRNKPSSDLTTYEAMLRYYDYDRFYSAETYVAALEALTHASEKEPDCGQVWSKLARLYADNAIFGFFDTGITLEHALNYAIKGVIINPDNQRARIILAALRMFCDELPAARVEIERALALNPKSLFYMDAIGYILTLLGDWDRGTMLIKEAISLNPYYHHFVHYGLWLNLFQKKEYEQAYQETMNFGINGNAWEPLARASTLGCMGRIDEGKRFAGQLLALCPDFQKQGRTLIRYYIKFEDIVEDVVEGLSRVGLIVT